MSRKRLIVGLTGGIGSGKTAVTDLFAKLDIVVVDADICAREVVAPGQPALDLIAQRYGAEILLKSGALNRRALREIVFARAKERDLKERDLKERDLNESDLTQSDLAERDWLESITHPLIAQRIQQYLTASTSAYSILVSPLLLETAQHTLCDRIIVVDVPQDVQISRASERDKSDAPQIKAIISAQTSREKRLAAAHYVLDNQGDLADLAAKVQDLHAKLLKFELAD